MALPSSSSNKKIDFQLLVATEQGTFSRNKTCRKPPSLKCTMSITKALEF